METVLSGVAVYALLFLVIRLSGRRTLAEMTPFDLVLVLVIAETTQQALTSTDYSITNMLVLIVTLVSIDVALSFLKRSSETADKLIDGRPTLLVAHGKPDDRALHMARMDVDDIMVSARVSHGLERLDQVKYAVLESSGHISIVPEQ